MHLEFYFFISIKLKQKKTLNAAPVLNSQCWKVQQSITAYIVRFRRTFLQRMPPSGMPIHFIPHFKHNTNIWVLFFTRPVNREYCSWILFMFYLHRFYSLSMFFFFFVIFGYFVKIISVNDYFRLLLPLSARLSPAQLRRNALLGFD